MPLEHVPWVPCVCASSFAPTPVLDAYTAISTMAIMHTKIASVEQIRLEGEPQHFCFIELPPNPPLDPAVAPTVAPTVAPAVAPAVAPDVAPAVAPDVAPAFSSSAMLDDGAGGC